LGDDPAERRLLLQLAEDAKMKLSTETQTQVILPHSFHRGSRCAVTVTREAFEHATADITERMVAPAERAMADAGLSGADLDRVILVGGMTRMPAVRALVRRVTGIEPYAHVDPDRVVALGAAVQAGVLAGQVRKVTLVDVTPLSLGIETQGGLFARIIERNTAIPARKSRLFTNARDDQETIEVHVLQGERELAADNMALGQFDLTGITPQARGEAKVEVVFDIDANGVIHVSATDLQTDTSRRIRLQAVGSVSREAAADMVSDSRKRMATDRRKREEIEAAIRAENLIRAAGQLLGESAAPGAPEVSGPALRAAERGVQAVQEALAAGQPQRIADAAKTLEASLKKLSAELKAAPRKQAQGHAA
jgi:molecular chaperone DnaK